jgi:hypothetical protein
MLIAIWHLSRDEPSTTPAATSSPPCTPKRTKNRALHQLQDMGYTVTLNRAG